MCLQGLAAAKIILLKFKKFEPVAVQSIQAVHRMEVGAMDRHLAIQGIQWQIGAGWQKRIEQFELVVVGFGHLEQCEPLAIGTI